MRITSRAELREWMRRDAAAHGFDRVRRRDLVTRPTLRFLRALRRAEYLANTKTSPVWKPVTALAKLRLHRLGVTLGFDLPINVAGPGLALPHWGSLVVSRQTRIGPDCLLHSGVNIGEGRGGAPQLGAHCYVGPGAALVGGVVLGDNCVVGANAVVTKSFPANSVVAGVPARLIRVEERPWPQRRPPA